MPFWGRLGRPWGQQDRLEVANDRILVDSGLILGLVYASFSGSTTFLNWFLFGLFPDHVFIDFWPGCQRLAFPNRRFRKASIAKIDCSWKSFFKNSWIVFCVLLMPWEPFF